MDVAFEEVQFSLYALESAPSIVEAALLHLLKREDEVLLNLERLSQAPGLRCERLVTFGDGFDARRFDELEYLCIGLRAIAFSSCSECAKVYLYRLDAVRHGWEADRARVESRVVEAV